jgi:hypothetical protein
VRRSSKAEKPQPATPAGMEKVRVTKEFIQPIEASTKQVIEVNADDVTDVTDEPQLDRFDKFFARVREEQGWRIVIYRLNSFHKDGRTDLRADKTYVGNIVFDPDTYLDDVQRMWPEGGTFKIQSKTPDNEWFEQWTETIAPVRNPTAAGAPQTHYFIQQQPAQQQTTTEPRDTLKEFLASLKTVKEIKEVIGDNGQQQQPIREATPVTVEPPPLQDRIIEAALNAALKTEEPKTIAGLLQSYLNPRSDEFSWKELIGEVIKPMVPMFMGLVGAYMQNQALRQQQQAQAGQQASATQNTQGQLPPARTPGTVLIQSAQGAVYEVDYTSQVPDGYTTIAGSFVPSVQSPQQQQPTFTMPTFEIPQNAMPSQAPLEPRTANEDEEAEMAEGDLIDSLVSMLQDCVNRAASDPAVVEAARKEIVEFKQRFPKLDQFITMLASAPPIFVIGMLSMQYPGVAPLVNNPVAIQVIEDLQAALKQKDDELQ